MRLLGCAAARSRICHLASPPAVLQRLSSLPAPAGAALLAVQATCRAIKAVSRVRMVPPLSLWMLFIALGQQRETGAQAGAHRSMPPALTPASNRRCACCPGRMRCAPDTACLPAAPLCSGPAGARQPTGASRRCTGGIHGAGGCAALSELGGPPALVPAWARPASMETRSIEPTCAAR